MQFDEFFGSFPFFSPFPVRGRVASIDFIDVDDVDDASEEKVVISEQLWEWFGLFCFCLVTLIKVAFVVFASGHPLLRRQNRFVFNFFKEEIIQASTVVQIFSNFVL